MTTDQRIGMYFQWTKTKLGTYCLLKKNVTKLLDTHDFFSKYSIVLQIVLKSAVDLKKRVIN